MGGVIFTWASIFTILLLFSLSSSSFTPAEAYGSEDRNGNITIKWDLMSWTPDGYVAVVTIYNFQKHRGIEAPGWQLGWTWAEKEVIWATMGGRTLGQSDCSSKFRGNIPECCKKSPTIVDLKVGTPYTKQIANCCKGGVLTSWFQDRPDSISAVQITVGQAGTTNKTVRLPKSFTFKAPVDGYACGLAKIVKPTRFITPDRRRFCQALMTWNVTCLYSGKRKPLV